MVYPFLTSENATNMRTYLIKNKIYVPQWWKWVLSDLAAGEFEQKLSAYLYPLPIDQRYTVQDMDDIAQIVMKGLKAGAII